MSPTANLATITASETSTSPDSSASPHLPFGVLGPEEDGASVVTAGAAVVTDGAAVVTDGAAVVCFGASVCFGSSVVLGVPSGAGAALIEP